MRNVPTKASSTQPLSRSDGRLRPFRASQRTTMIGIRYCRTLAAAALPCSMEEKYVYCTPSMPNRLKKRSRFAAVRFRQTEKMLLRFLAASSSRSSMPASVMRIMTSHSVENPFCCSRNCAATPEPPQSSAPSATSATPFFDGFMVLLLVFRFVSDYSISGGKRKGSRSVGF